MSYLNDKTYLFALLVREGLLSEKQREMLNKKALHQRQLIMREQRKKNGSTGRVREPDLVEIMVSLHLEIPGDNPQPLTEEMIVRAVARDHKLPFKKLDPLDLDMEVVTKTIPKNYAVKHLMLPFAFKNGVHEIDLYDPVTLYVLAEIERANKISIEHFLSTRTDISRMLSEVFGFQRSIWAA